MNTFNKVSCIPIILSVTVVLILLILLSIFRDEGAFSTLIVWPKHIQLLCLSIFTNAIYQSIYYFQLRKGLYKSISISKLIYSLSNVASSILLGVLSSLSYKLIISFLIGRVLSALFLLAILLRQHMHLVMCLEIKEIFSSAKKYSDFPKYSMPQALTDNFRINIINALISSTYGLDTLGLYSLSQRIIYMPLSLFSSSISQVFYQKASTSSRLGESENLFKLVKKVIFFSSLLIIFPMFVLAGFLPLGFQMVFGQQWLDAGYIALIILPWLSVNFLSSCVSTIPIVCSQQKKFFLVSLIYNLSIPFVLLCFSKLMDYGFKTSLIAVSSFGSFYLLILVAWFLRLSSNKIIERNA